MHRIVCEDCKKSYDYAKDEFCPRCGAFNQPTKTWGTDAQGNIIRVDGVNERDHAGSFAHKEVHREKAVRKITGMDRRPQSRDPRSKPPRRDAPSSRPAVPSQMSSRAQSKTELADSAALHILLWIIGVMVFVSFIVPWLFALL